MPSLKRSFPAFVLLIIAGTLLNSNAFGGHTLIAYFLYCFLTGLFASSVFFFMTIKGQQNGKYPPYIWVFLIFTAYIVVRGVAKGSLNFSHYYWIATACFLVIVIAWNTHESQNLVPRASRSRILFWGISVISLTESSVVILQCLKVFPVPNKNFLCTGTWINPNVTALFIALSLVAIFEVKKFCSSRLLKTLRLIILVAALVAIIALMSRTAYIVSALLLGREYWLQIKTGVSKHFKFNLTGLAMLSAAALICFMLASVFAYKAGSTRARIQVWQTSIELIGNSPLVGHGFGEFEKHYNIFAAGKAFDTNDHVNMAYNDLIEVGVEGGIIGMSIWILFLSLLFIAAYKQRQSNKYFLALTCCFIVIQLTTFGFQAIPAWVLFILYVGVYTPRQTTATKQRLPLPTYARKLIFSSAGVGVSLFLLLSTTNLMSGFYNKWVLTLGTAGNSVVQLSELEHQLNGYALFHETYGDELLKQKNTELALGQYLKALEKSSSPDLIGKAGLCYELLGRYDKSEAQYLLVQKMQPHRLLPRFALLKLYEKTKAADKLYAKANEILAVPVKIPTRKAAEIKLYARNLLNISFGGQPH